MAGANNNHCLLIPPAHLYYLYPYTGSPVICLILGNLFSHAFLLELALSLFACSDHSRTISFLHIWIELSSTPLHWTLFHTLGTIHIHLVTATFIPGVTGSILFPHRRSEAALVSDFILLVLGLKFASFAYTLLGRSSVLKYQSFGEVPCSG